MLRASAPEARDRLAELREQAEVVLQRLEDLYEQAQPAIDEGKKSARHGATAASLASEISADTPRSKRPAILMILVIVGAVAFLGWKRCGRHTDVAEPGRPPVT